VGKEVARTFLEKSLKKRKSVKMAKKTTIGIQKSTNKA
jgi:hypothetical protein